MQQSTGQAEVLIQMEYRAYFDAGKYYLLTDSCKGVFSRSDESCSLLFPRKVNGIERVELFSIFKNKIIISSKGNLNNTSCYVPRKFTTSTFSCAPEGLETHLAPIIIKNLTRNFGFEFVGDGGFLDLGWESWAGDALLGFYHIGIDFTIKNPE